VEVALDEPGLQLRLARESAIAVLDAHLTGKHRASRLSAADMHLRSGCFRNGWAVALEEDGKRFDIVLLVGDAFPFEPPELHFAGTDQFLLFPHVDAKGKLCLTNAAATFSPSRITETIEFLIAEARRLISDSLSGRNANDFIQEFHNYWRVLPYFSSDRSFWFLFEPSPPTRCVFYYAANGFTLFGDSDEQLEVWLKHSIGSLPKGFQPRTTVIIWLEMPLVPSRYPRRAQDVLLLARESTREADALLASVIPPDPVNLPVLLAFGTKAGPVVAGVTVPEPKTAKASNPKVQRNCRTDGYRAGHMHGNLLVNRYFCETKLFCHEVTGINAKSCLKRGGNGRGLNLLNKRVVIVGCGSLGADIAFMLAKSGVGALVLIDNEALTWGNVTRHILGGESVGQNKASALATFLMRQLPWMSVVTETSAVEDLVYKRPRVLQENDLIISTTGDWTGECILNSALRTFARFPPVLFGWTEAYGFAGHALAALPHGGCLACGTSEFGVFETRVTDWPEGQQPLVQATGCSDLYQPYGITDVAPTKALITELAIDVLTGHTTKAELRTFIGDMRRLTELGGQFGPRWRDKMISGGLDRRVFVTAWPANPNCPLCK
jgi:molybdopterin/thiamine biosynthesis adenylyltransferase